MIISCICGKYEFEVNQNDIPKEGRNVQCGICNETWFQTPYEKNINYRQQKHTLFCIFISFFFNLYFVCRNNGNLQRRFVI